MVAVGPCSRSVYLITYSQADLESVGRRRWFSDMVLDSFYRNAKANVLRWVSSKEEQEHKDQGNHYHMAINSDWQKRSLSVKLDKKFGIKIRFSDKHSNYYEASKYVTKEDINYTLSEGHPDLLNSAVPRTTTTAKVKCERHGEKHKRKIDALELRK